MRLHRTTVQTSALAVWQYYKIVLQVVGVVDVLTADAVEFIFEVAQLGMITHDEPPQFSSHWMPYASHSNKHDASDAKT